MPGNERSQLDGNKVEFHFCRPIEPEVGAAIADQDGVKTINYHFCHLPAYRGEFADALFK